MSNILRMINTIIGQISKDVQIKKELYINYNFQIILMKNCLQLEIVSLLKKANENLINKQLDTAIQLYQEALCVFYQNRKYNSEVSPHYETLILSLRGLIHFYKNEHELAQADFTFSLQVNPNDYLTLIRRANLYCSINKYADAIEDAERAYFCDPEGKYMNELVQKLKTGIKNVQDGSERERLEKNIQSIFRQFEEESEIIDEELLNFTNLKKIDRLSVSLSQRNSKKSVFRSEIVSKNEEDCDENVSPIQIIHKKGKKKNTYNSLKKPFSIHHWEEDNIENTKSCQNSFSNISANIGSRGSVKFFSGEGGDHSLNCPKKELGSEKKRKSCLRLSKIETTSTDIPTKKCSSFMHIKNIDGTPIGSFLPREKETEAKGNSLHNKQQKQQCKQGFSSDEDNGQHNIYGVKYGSIKILKCLQNLNNWSGKMGEGQKKKQSILKKNSLIGSEKSGKKSVCFLKEERKKEQ